MGSSQEAAVRAHCSLKPPGAPVMASMRRTIWADLYLPDHVTNRDSVRLAVQGIKEEPSAEDGRSCLLD
jgi:hypothetical protein